MNSKFYKGCSLLELQYHDSEKYAHFQNADIRHIRILVCGKSIFLEMR